MNLCNGKMESYLHDFENMFSKSCKYDSILPLHKFITPNLELY